MYFRITGSVLSSLAAALTTSCSAPQNSAAPAPDGRPTVQFSAQDKAAARSLSIGNTTTLQGAKDPYQLAMLCSVAIDTLMATLRQSAILSGEQLKAMEQIRGVYASRVQALAAANGTGRAAIEKDLAELRNADDDQAEQARTAIGCIQRLQ